MEALESLGLTGMGFISQIVNFVAIMLLLNALLYKPVSKALIARRDRIAQGIKDADQAGKARAEAEQDGNKILEEARMEASRVTAQATQDADKVRQDIISRANEEAMRIRTEAQEEGEAQKAEALASASRQIAELSMLGAQRILGRELQHDVDQDQLIADLMAGQNRS